MNTFCNIYAGLMVLSMVISLFLYPVAMIGFAAFYFSVMWVLESGKRKAERDKSNPLGPYNQSTECFGK